MSTHGPSQSPSESVDDRRPEAATESEEALQRNLRASIADGVAFSVMVGCGETFIAPFALAVGFGPMVAGMISTLPILFGATVQLFAPFVVAKVGTNRGWVVACVGLQAASFLPLSWWAWRGHADAASLFIAVGVYWASGMASSPAWNAWIGTLVPASRRIGFFAQRNRLSQAGVMVGFVAGGAVLQAGQQLDRALDAFAILFFVAAVARFISMYHLARCSEPEPPSALGTMAPSAAASLRLSPGAPTTMLLLYLWSMAAAAQFAAPYFVPYMIKTLGLSYWAFMVVVAASFLAKTLALPLLGRVASRIGSVGLLWLGGLSVVPLAMFWLASDNVGYLVGLQIAAGFCWAAYELAAMLIFFDAVSNRDRAGIVSTHTFGVAIATVAGAAAGGGLLRMLGEERNAYFTVFAASSLLRLLTLPLLWRLRSSKLIQPAEETTRPEGTCERTG